MNSFPPAQRRPRRRRGNPRCGPRPIPAYTVPQDLTPSLPLIPQATCPLFTHIPAEIRNTIYAYTLESSSSPDDPSSTTTTATASSYAQQALYYRPGFKSPKRISTSLLQTCQQIYNEASLLPPAINHHTFWCYRPPPHVKNPSSPADYFARMTPKQRSAVQELHFFTQQFFLEDSSWANMWATNEAWQLQMRKGKRKLEANADEAGDQEKREAKRREAGVKDSQEPEEDSSDGVLSPKKMTLTLRHTDWWFWEDNEPLGIDPFRTGRTRADEMGEVRRPLTPWEEERVWGNQFKRLPSLEEFVIEFETVMRKRDQLDAIVQMALRWRFPLVLSEREKVFLVADEGSRKAYTWIGAKEDILRDVVMGVEDQDGQGGNASQAVKPPPRLIPFDAEKEFKTDAVKSGQEGEGSKQTEQKESQKKQQDFDTQTEEKYYVVFVTWRRQRAN